MTVTESMAVMKLTVNDSDRLAPGYGGHLKMAVAVEEESARAHRAHQLRGEPHHRRAHLATGGGVI
jgi:hypothetical protein